MNLHQLGTAEESTYGTYEAPDRFFELLPGESLDRENMVLQGEGLQAGNLYRLGPRRFLTRSMGSGAFSAEVATTQFGRLFEHMLGGVATSQPDAGGSPTVYNHLFTPATLPEGLTIQKGVEESDGVVTPFSFLGCKVTQWEMTISIDNFLVLALTMDAQQVVTTESLATATFPDLELLHFTNGELLIDSGSPVACVTDVTITGTNGLNVDRICLGNNGLKLEPFENAYREISGTISAEFDNLTDFYNLFEGDTSAQLDLEFTGSNIENAFDHELNVTLFDVRFEGEVPKITGPEPAVQNVPFTAYVTDAGDSIEIFYQTDDATP